MSCITFGIPREIGTLVEQALTYAMLDQKRTVTPDMVLTLSNRKEERCKA
jgi:hypothetical protein